MIKAKSVKWIQSYIDHGAFIVEWSNDNWTKYEFDVKNPKIDYKLILDIGYIIRRELSQEDAKNYLKLRFEELDCLMKD